jgi:hypothetical protein
MSDEPKFSFFRLSIKPMSSRNGNGSKPHLISSIDTAPDEEQRANIKRMYFFLGVAILLVLANQLGKVKDDSDLNSSASSLAGTKLDIYPQQHPDNHVGLVRFRLSNMGNHPVFYPVPPGTNVPNGQIVTRISTSSAWITLPATSQQQGSITPQYVDRNLVWIEMPPGGWIDGEFSDSGESIGEHAYAIFLKPKRTAATARFVSETYYFDRN